MPSRAERRRTAEWALRAVLLAALGVALWRSLRPADEAGSVRAISASALPRELDALVATPSVRATNVLIDAMPSAAERDLLVALRRAGVTVQWHGTPPALALEAVRVREPDERVRVLVAPVAATLALVDSAGVLDSVRTHDGATVEAAGVVGAVRAEQGRFSARATAGAGQPRRAVLVLGSADWESKFVAAALGEAGWTVRSRIPLAPGVAVRDDALLPIDTSRYDAVVALDSSAADLLPAIVRFVAQGGGLVAGGSALALAPLAALAPARAGDRMPGRILLADDSVTPRDLPLRPFASLRADAVTLGRERAGPSLVARRAGLGRVLGVGYDDSWRWRMLGGESGLAAHRRWWSAAVGSVAPERTGDSRSTGDAAPLASLVSALGPPSAPAPGSGPVTRDILPVLLLLLIAGALLAETASRRFRGER